MMSVRGPARQRCLVLAFALSALAGGCGGGAGSPAAPGAQPARSASGPLPGYDGSDSCKSCHAAQYASWQGSTHARTVHTPSDAEKRLLGQSLLCNDYDAKYVLGERHARRFLVESEQEPGRHVMLPCRYDIAPAEWSRLHESDWKTLTWERSCGACHTTGFSSDSLAFHEIRVGCEACHGPANRHAGFGRRGEMIKIGALTARDEVLLCAACHLQGGTSRSTGLSFAYNHEPGGDLLADYRFDWTTLEGQREETDNPIDIHQKLLIREFAVGGQAEGAGAPTLRCTSCHEAHMMGHVKHAALPREEFCYLCHAREGFKVKEYSQACNVCEF
ncbi:MAG TPA: multiheme c-type cytochrome [Candidatus Polarisedimenticolia bacterium]|nr:multiheme c-type cytochrome [Candidatus Polarisedimenticolia bacterium]